MTNLEWEKKFDELYPIYIDCSVGDPDWIDLKSFISQSHKDLVEAIIGDVERNKNWDKVEPNFDLPNYLRAKYLNKTNLKELE